MQFHPRLITSLDRPIALSGINPRTIEGKAWWDKTRKKVYAQYGHRCACCGVPKEQAIHRQWLEAHESYQTDWETGEVTLENIWPLCHFCHHFIHRDRAINLMKLGKLSREYVKLILTHGFTLMVTHNLKPQSMPENSLKWEDYHFSYKDKIYRSRFDNLAHRNAYYEWLGLSELKDNEDNLTTFSAIWQEVKAMNVGSIIH